MELELNLVPFKKELSQPCPLVSSRTWQTLPPSGHSYLGEYGSDPDEAGGDPEKEELPRDGGAPRTLRSQQRRPRDHDLDGVLAAEEVEARHRHGWISRNNRSDVGWGLLLLYVSVQSVLIAGLQGLLESFCASFFGNFLLVWLHSSCTIAHLPGELQQKHSSKPCDRAIDALCSWLVAICDIRLSPLSRLPYGKITLTLDIE